MKKLIFVSLCVLSFALVSSATTVVKTQTPVKKETTTTTTANTKTPVKKEATTTVKKATTKKATNKKEVKAPATQAKTATPEKK